MSRETVVAIGAFIHEASSRLMLVHVCCLFVTVKYQKCKTRVCGSAQPWQKERQGCRGVAAPLEGATRPPPSQGQGLGAATQLPVPAGRTVGARRWLTDGRGATYPAGTAARLAPAVPALRALPPSHGAPSWTLLCPRLSLFASGDPGRPGRPKVDWDLMLDRVPERVRGSSERFRLCTGQEETLLRRRARLFPTQEPIVKAVIANR